MPESGVFDDADLTRKLIHGYYTSVSYMDAQFGKVLDELDRLGLAEETIVLLWGDHGFHLGDHGFWTKHTNYEQASRIPVLIRVHGVTKAASVTEHLIETVDLFPTLVELAGLPKPKVPQPFDGKSQSVVLHDPSVKVSDHVYHCYPAGEKIGRAIRTDRYRLVEWKKPGAEVETAEFELYDYQTDPLETRNLANQEIEVMKAMQGILSRHPEAAPRAR